MTRYNKYSGALRSLYWILFFSSHLYDNIGFFSLSTRYKLNLRSLSTRQHECALLAQEAHTSPKSHHKINI
jgi:CBS domain containing-hemolysin-like protein